MKIAVYLPPGEPFSPKNGGALATWTSKVYPHLRNGHEIVVVARTSDDVYDFPEMYSCHSNSLLASVSTLIRNRQLKGTLHPLKRYLRQSFARRAGNICREWKPKLIHIHNDPDAVVPIRRRNPNATIVLHMNNDHLVEGVCADDGTAAEAVKAADWVGFCSQYCLSQALASIRSLDSSKCFIIHNGADLQPEITENRKFGFKSTGGPVILFMGRIVPNKGLHVLLEAMPTVLRTFPQARLQIVGGVTFGSSHVDNYLASLKEIATQLGNAVSFVGPVPHHEIKDHLAAADLFVCPSIWNDPLPLVNAEAMGASVPVVAFSRGGIPEVVGDAGLLISECSAAALATGICKLLSDDDLRRDYASRGRVRAEQRFSWQKIAQDWQQRIHRMTDIDHG